MARKQSAKEQDKFVIRLPEGMRDRIKSKAERAGMSMNDAIIWCLEREFPAEITFEERIGELANLVSMLKDSKNPDQGVENLIAEMDATLSDIYHKRLPVDRPFRHMVHDRLTYWQELEMDNYRDTHESPFDDANWPSDEDRLSKMGNNPFLDTKSDLDEV